MSTTLTIAEFVHEDAQQVISEMKADLELRLGRVFAAADVEMLIINGFAYREMLIRAGMNDTGRQNLVAFGRGSMLDYLAQLVGVARLPASGALCTLEFNLVTGHTGVTIPEGMRVQSTDGKVIFVTTLQTVVSPGDLTAEVPAECIPTGKIGNGYAIGTISVILDPVAFVTTVANTNETAGGADEESDDELRERIKLAPSAFSVAGPSGAYKFFAKSASPVISDVSVISPSPGVVNIYVLAIDAATITNPVLDAVAAICNDEKVRPLTDTVNVAAATNSAYSIDAELTILPDAVSADIITAVTANLEKYKSDRVNRLGIDVVRSQLIALCMVPGVYDVNLVDPAADIVATPDVYTNCTGIAVTVTGTHDE